MRESGSRNVRNVLLHLFSTGGLSECRDAVAVQDMLFVVVAGHSCSVARAMSEEGKGPSGR